MIQYILIRSSRASIQISILPDHTIEVRAPFSTSQEQIDEIVSSRERWIQKKLGAQSRSTLFAIHHAYIAGETIMYLGKPYILHPVSEHAQKNSVWIDGKKLFVQTRISNVCAVQRAMECWQKQQAAVVFKTIFEESWTRFSEQYPHAQKPDIRLRSMKTRWGSMTQPNNTAITPRMTLNILLICAKPYCIKQVVYHELCHLVHPNHSRAFYEAFEFFVPDWKETKKLLEETFGK